jgi:hypothetical protein
VRLGVILFYVTTAVIFFQLLAGGLLVFGFIAPNIHIAVGFVTLLFAMMTMSVALVSKPTYRPAKVFSIALVVLVIVQGLLGFIVLGTGSLALTFVHFTNALVIYSIGLGGVFFATRWSRMPVEGKQGRVVPALVIAIAVWLALFIVEALTH